MLTKEKVYDILLGGESCMGQGDFAELLQDFFNKHSGDEGIEPQAADDFAREIAAAVCGED